MAIAPTHLGMGFKKARHNGIGGRRKPQQLIEQLFKRPQPARSD